jgi:hypothetical protein
VQLEAPDFIIVFFLTFALLPTLVQLEAPDFTDLLNLNFNL